MNANELTFGCEIECTLPYAAFTDHGIEVGGHGHGLQVPGLPQGWRAEYDSSIEAEYGVSKGVEMVSPVLRGEQGLRQVQSVCRTLCEWGAKVNNSSGFHVHVGFNPIYVRSLRRLVHLTSHYEPALYAMSGNYHRRTCGYCKPIKADFCDIRWPNFQGHYQAGDRYHVLNLSNLINNRARKRTAEFRVFAGTVIDEVAITYIRVALAMVERAHNDRKLHKWDQKPSTFARSKGQGYQEVLRFVYRMGWLGTWQKTVFGGVVADGLPTMAQSAELLKAAADRYDARA